MIFYKAESQSAIYDIMPHELQLKKTTECETQLSYLDIHWDLR